VVFVRVYGISKSPSFKFRGMAMGVGVAEFAIETARHRMDGTAWCSDQPKPLFPCFPFLHRRHGVVALHTSSGEGSGVRLAPSRRALRSHSEGRACRPKHTQIHTPSYYITM